ncbi:hypothetical protein H9636_02685 [Ureibacillus sp. Re31]|uniref:Uncharacterized protein n=1 Tax=Ureibacillus galli TaxID=2762222 RepID=A0ABR8X8Z0_9BACL|nr:hypothetical protein [Ureibacillus galli]MBD8025557.1 hypothetical protein [Ureibacillus galli]
MLSDYEFNSYLYAHLDIEVIKQQYERERAEAYENVSPTISLFDYEVGKIVSGSVSVEEHAIFLATLYEQFQKNVKMCNKRIELLNEAISLLYEDEKAQFEAWKVKPRGNYPKVLKTLRECLAFVLEGVADSQLVENEMSAEEWDAAVDEMDQEELFQDYWDHDDTFDKEIIKRRSLFREHGQASNSELIDPAC